MQLAVLRPQQQFVFAGFHALPMRRCEFGILRRPLRQLRRIFIHGYACIGKQGFMFLAQQQHIIAFTQHAHQAVALGNQQAFVGFNGIFLQGFVQRGVCQQSSLHIFGQPVFGFRLHVRFDFAIFRQPKRCVFAACHDLCAEILMPRQRVLPHRGFQHQPLRIFRLLFRPFLRVFPLMIHCVGSVLPFDFDFVIFRSRLALQQIPPFAQHALQTPVDADKQAFVLLHDKFLAV